MDKLGSILKKWNQEKDIKSLISGGLFSDQSAIQSDLEKLSEKERGLALEQLSEVENAIKAYIDEINIAKNDVQNQLDATLKSAKACLSYGLSIDIQNHGKNTKDD